MTRLDEAAPPKEGNFAMKIAPGGMESIRWAAHSDISAILALLENPSLHSKMRMRSSTYVKEQIEKSCALVMEDDRKRVVAYAEIALFVTKAEIADFALKFQWTTYRYQENDALLYIAGLVSDGNPRGCTARIASFVSENLFASDKDLRRAWSLNPTRSNNTSHPERPRRVIISSASMTSDGTGNQLLSKYAAGALGESPSLYLEVPHKVQDGSNRTGYLLVVYVDRPLTPHQEERTKRNRYLITNDEQRRLLSSRIGVVGLSTGSVVLEALLRAGVGGIYRLADFDTFEVSNSNRMLYGMDQVGQPKVDLCTARIKSVDPDLIVEPFPHGLTAENVEAFVEDCDLIIEECDDFPVKMMVRQAAQSAKVPVLMGTSQNGMIDVERYDVDTGCRPFHLHPSQLSQATSDKKDQSKSEEHGGQAKQEEIHGRGQVMNLYDVRQISERFLVSFGELGRSISSWPQLAEEVFLNAATITHASRRILLGDTSVVSGRFSIRMDQILTPYNRCATQSPKQDLHQQGLAPLPRLPFAWDQDLEQAMKQTMFVDYWARTAPSGGNTQFWQTRMVVDTPPSPHEAGTRKRVELEIYLRQRGLMTLPEYHKWAEWALGAMMESAEIAAAHLQLGLVYSAPVDTSEESSMVTRLYLTREGKEVEKLASKSRLFPALAMRSSVRTTGPWTEKLPMALLDRLNTLGIVLVQDDVVLNKIRQAILAGTEARIVQPTRRQELLREIGATATSIHPALLGLSAAEEQNMKLLGSKLGAIDFMVANGFHHHGLLKTMRLTLEGIKYFFVATDNAIGQNENSPTGEAHDTAKDATVVDQLRRGRRMQTAWLEIVQAGVGARPFSLHVEQQAMLDIPGAFFVWAAVQPDQQGLCSARL